MREVLPLGTIVKLKHGPEKLMIICRLPLFNNMGTIGYFDYSACLYPAKALENISYPRLQLKFEEE